MKFTDVFKNEYYNKLLTPNGNNPVRNRADGFLIMFDLLEKKESNHFIVETGTMRADHGELCFGDDGCSTYLFDKFINYYNGHLISIDNNVENIEYCRKKVSSKVTFLPGDSVKHLTHIIGVPDLIYLDSFDLDINNPLPSQIHHLKELCSIIKMCNKGTILAVDDHILPNGMEGKGKLVKEYLDTIEVNKIYEGYQLIYQF